MEDEVKHLIHAAVLAEREACAAVADNQAMNYLAGHDIGINAALSTFRERHACHDVAESIRARSDDSTTASPLPEASISSLPKPHRNAP
jgi:hypothetical protein